MKVHHTFLKPLIRAARPDERARVGEPPDRPLWACERWFSTDPCCSFGNTPAAAWSADEIAGIGIYVPPGEEGERVTLACPGVYESHETDLRTAGAAISLVALNQLCWHFHERGLTGVSDACSDLFHRARTEFFADTAGLDARTLYAYID